MTAILRKELADYFTSIRFVVLFVLVFFVSAAGLVASSQGIRGANLPEGIVYSPTFFQRTSRPLLANFGKDPRILVDAAAKLGGRKVAYGDVAVTIDAFNRVPITIILWRGDDELAPQGNVVFDANISDYLPTEDITVLCETITWRLIRNLR